MIAQRFRPEEARACGHAYTSRLPRRPGVEIAQGRYPFSE